MKIEKGDLTRHIFKKLNKELDAIRSEVLQMGSVAEQQLKNIIAIF